MTWKTLATPKFRLRAEIGGRELMNIGWEWGVPEEELFCIYKDKVYEQEDLSLISDHAWSGDEVHTGSV